MQHEKGTADPPPPRSIGSTRPKDRNPGLELFFDLVFVLGVSQLADVLHEDPTWAKFATVLLLFVPVWWTWTGVTFVLNRFPTDDNWTNLALLSAAAGSGAMALAIPSIPGPGSDWYALGYATVRIILSPMYLRARSQDRRLANFYATGFAATGLVWVISIAVPTSAQPYVWAVALVADVSIPALADRTQRISPVDEHHLPDRFSAFAIIVLGESAVNTVSVAHRPFTTSAVAVLAEGFALSALLWWGFFDRNAWQARYRLLADRDNSGRIAYIVCAYLHFPVVAGVILAGAGTQIAVEDPSGEVPLSSALLISTGIAAYLLTLNVMTWVLRTPPGSSLAWPRTALLALLAVWLWFGRAQPTLIFIGGCLVVLGLHVTANIGRGRQGARSSRPWSFGRVRGISHLGAQDRREVTDAVDERRACGSGPGQLHVAGGLASKAPLVVAQPSFSCRLRGTDRPCSATSQRTRLATPRLGGPLCFASGYATLE